MTSDRLLADADVTFLTAADGGRRIAVPALSGLGYRPHIVVGDPAQRSAIKGATDVIAEEYLGVAFDSGPTVPVARDVVRVRMMLMYWPNVAYDAVVPGAFFTIREGPQVIGHGRVIRKWVEPRESRTGGVL